MARRIGLRTRLARLELRASRCKPLPVIVAAIHSDEAPGEVLGMEGLGIAVMRVAGEPTAALAARAATLTGTRILKTLYDPSLPKVEPAAAPARPAEAVPVDPWALAGIGRRASRAELVKMGAIAVPPERNV